ncbi:alpha/beta hydrolase [Peijinzhouia sedimentorum]
MKINIEEPYIEDILYSNTHQSLNPMKKWSKRKIFKTIWFTIVGIFFIWNLSTFQSRDLPEDVFENSSNVTVNITDDYLGFESNLTGDAINVIFFQGGLVDPKAYAPLGRKLAENGYNCYIIKMNWRLPINDYQKTLELFDLPNGKYVIGGHSQGAKMAAQLVYENPSLFEGLFLLGTSHPRDIDLSNSAIPTLKLYAENDGLASVPEVMENRNKLPVGADLVLVEGGNHSQFGYMGQLFMDSSADISLEEQQKICLENMLSLLEKVAQD